MQHQQNKSKVEQKNENKKQQRQQKNEKDEESKQHDDIQQGQGNKEDNQQMRQSNNNKNQEVINLQHSKVSLQKSGVKQELWKPYDFLFPGGKLAKLIKISNIYKKNLPIREMLDKFKYTQPTPVINLIGAMQKGRGKFFAGIARAAFNTDAVIVDNGLASGIEKFTLRRGVKLIGIAPQNQIKFPKINPSQIDPMQLANGHTHLFLANNPDKDLRWGGQTSFKIDVCIKVAEGKKKSYGVPRCKIVSILLGDATFDQIQELKMCVQNDIPIIVVPGSSISDNLISLSDGNGHGNSQLNQLIDKGHFFYCKSTNSQDIAQLTHLLLSITPW